MTVVIYHCEEEGCWAESPDLPGFSAAAAALPELREQVRAAITEILGEHDLDERFDWKMVLGRTQIAIAGTTSAMMSASTTSGTAAQVHRATTRPITTPPRAAAS